MIKPVRDHVPTNARFVSRDDHVEFVGFGRIDELQKGRTLLEFGSADGVFEVNMGLGEEFPSSRFNESLGLAELHVERGHLVLIRAPASVDCSPHLSSGSNG